MKRLSSSSDSLGGLMSICPNSTVDVDEHKHGSNPMYTREFETMLEEEGCGEESGQISEKKRRLSVDQVKALEKNFEVENKLEPERKAKLAQELGLQPRQVAVWFQNRRARWKTKQLERDYGLLKANHEALKHKYESLHTENQSLLNQIRELNGKEEASVSESEEKCEVEIHEGGAAHAMEHQENEMMGAVFGDGSSDSDSSTILNSPITSSGGILHHSPHRFGFWEANPSLLVDATKIYQTQFVKIEEHNFFGEESCSTFFSDDQPPSLHWYCNDEWY